MDTFEQQLIKNLPRFRKFAWVITNCSNDYEDFVQRGILRAWKFRHLYVEKSSLASWICRIIHNEWKSHLRDKVRNGTRTVDKFPERSDDRSVRDAEANMMLQKVSKIYNEKMSPKEKKVMRLIADGYEPIEISRKEGIPRGSVYSVLADARKKLRSELNLGLT